MHGLKLSLAALFSRYISNNTILSTWLQPSFADTTWALGTTRMGYGPDLGGAWNTVLPGPAVSLHHYFRTTFCLSATRLTWLRQQSLRLKVLADNGADVYINGMSLLQDAASNHDPVYWNNDVSVPGTSTAFVQGEHMSLSMSHGWLQHSKCVGRGFCRRWCRAERSVLRHTAVKQIQVGTFLRWVSCCCQAA